MSSLAAALPGLVGVKTTTVALQEPVEVLAARFAGEPGSVVLLSGGELDCARYHILAVRPWLTITGWPGKTMLEVDGRSFEESRPPLDILRDVLVRCHLDPQEMPPPVAAGLFGYLAYDLKDDLEALPITSVDDLGLPSLFMAAPSLLLVQDRAASATRVHAMIREGQEPSAVDAGLNTFLRELERPGEATAGFSGGANGLHSNFTRTGYEAAVRRIREYIAAGDVYQVNLSQRFETDFSGDAYGLFQTLYAMNPAPFFAYVHAGDHQIVSTSPERFLLRTGSRVETRPIKGTRPRGTTPERDEQLKAELAESPKDDAELSMIVDLLRNDIGRACAGGSVVVAEHKRLEAYQNVYHLVSVVEGTLAEGKYSTDLIRAAFPGGSITGCPKIRAMEIIDELESRRRHVYTGSIGYVSFHDTMDLSIAIRTATVVGDRLVFSVGGGIVYDSDPASEYEETLHKGQTLLSVFESREGPQTAAGAREPQAWHNGALVPQSRAAVPVSDLGLQYGFGFFETLRVERGVVLRLSAHVARFNRSWRALIDDNPPDLTWDAIITQVVSANGLHEGTAAVKILATRGDASAQRFNGAIMVTARPYVHRLANRTDAGLRLATFPHPRMTPLAEHKSLNYLYYYQAGLWARKKGVDEALVLNPDGTFSETNSANILVVSGRKVTRPASSHVLPGVMQAAVCERLAARGFSIVEASIREEEVFGAGSVLLTNALMGVLPALSLDGRALSFDQTLVDALNRDLS